MNKLDICKLLPHAGTMCLIDRVLLWDNEHLVAEAESHLQAENPLRNSDSISSIIGVEYAAQTMAVHAALVSTKAKRKENNQADDFKQHKGYLATMRNIKVTADTLDTPGSTNVSPLIISVTLLMKDTQGYTYEFNITTHNDELLSGKLTIFLIS